MADLPTRISAVSAQRKFASAQIVHAQMEERVGLLLPCVLFDLGVDTQVHVPVNGGVVMADGYALGCWEQVCKVPRGGGDGIDGERVVCVVWNVVFREAVGVVGEVLFGG